MEPIGYRALVERYALQLPPHHCWSYASTHWERREEGRERLYPPSYRVGENVYDHLVFALKHEGINLLILKRVFEQLDGGAVAAWVAQTPTGKYARLLWYLYEWLLGRRLDLPDVGRGAYVFLLDPEVYYTAAPRRSPRHRVVNNALGTVEFCPCVRKTAQLVAYEQQQCDRAVRQLVQQYDQALLVRALQYLYTKETYASWEIERELLPADRAAQFAALLQQTARTVGPLTCEQLVALQQRIVDPRFALPGVRDFQNYVGEEPDWKQMIVHYIAPRPVDVQGLMEGLLQTYERMVASGCAAVVTAAVVAFGFVFIHPFWDGNGRIHRWLVHNALHRCGFVPAEMMLPVSAVMLRERRQYDEALETISRPLMASITEYALDDAGTLTVQQETCDLYRYMDLTGCAEYLFGCVAQVVEHDFEQELRWLQQYDTIKKQLREVVDMPEQLLDLFIKCLHQNEGHLSARKRQRYFAMLTDEEIQRMEALVGEIMRR